MKSLRNAHLLAVGLMLAAGSTAIEAVPLSWSVIVSNADDMPGPAAVKFNSFNQPSVNANGLVVFRARSKGGTAQGPVHGIYQRDMSGGANPIVEITSRGDEVPQPNNTLYNGVLSVFEEFASMPRIDVNSPLMATRGQSQPVWTYQLLDFTVNPPVLTDTRVGTSGIYTNPGNVLLTGASLLGSAVNVDQTTLTFPQFSVPDAPPGTRFDQFPGGPAVSDGQYISFKGNYTDPSDLLGKTGVYFRDVIPAAPMAPIPAIQVVANSNSRIPNQPPGGTTKFGSTAPPSAANGYMVFTGFDIEEAPTLGGIYRAPLASLPPLQTLIGVGDQVPDEPAGTTFTVFGEGLSISADGRYTSFWGAWGSETFPKVLHCVADGNADVIAYCLANADNHLVNIPVHQGIFVHDADTGQTYPIAKTGSDGIVDFLYWVFSGRPPGTGGGDEPTLEPPRWRSSAFAALSRMPGNAVQTAFKAGKAAFDGIYLRRGLSEFVPLIAIAETTMTSGQPIDAGAPAGAVVSTVGIERDGFRGDYLTVAVGMLAPDPADPANTLGWAGLYLAQVAGIPEGAPVVTSVASRKVHGSAGIFDLALTSNTSDPTIEPRGGPAHTIVFEFDKAVVDGVASVTEGSATVAGTVFSGNQMQVSLSGVGDQQYVAVSVSGVLAVGGGPTGAGTARVGFLLGDVNESGLVNSTDILIVKLGSGGVATALNFRSDLNASGLINSTDILIVKASSGHTLPTP